MPTFEVLQRVCLWTCRHHVADLYPGACCRSREITFPCLSLPVSALSTCLSISGCFCRPLFISVTSLLSRFLFLFPDCLYLYLGPFPSLLRSLPQTTAAPVTQSVRAKTVTDLPVEQFLLMIVVVLKDDQALMVQALLVHFPVAKIRLFWATTVRLMDWFAVKKRKYQIQRHHWP